MNIVKELQWKGITIEEIAEYFDIAVSTVYKHKAHANSTIINKMSQIKWIDNIIQDIKIKQFIQQYQDTVQYVPDCIELLKRYWYLK